MKTDAAALAIAAAIGWAAFLLWQDRNRQQWGRFPDELATATGGIVQSIEEAISKAAGSLGMVSISAMRRVDVALVNHKNVRAMFAVIRRGEGTSGPDGYRTLYGGGLFGSYADHPRQLVTRWGRTSSAAGAYQALAKVWDETRGAMRLPDFSPASQDLFALGRIAARGALEDVLAGRVNEAIAKINKEWASMPGSPYGQGTISLETARSVYALAGGIIAGAVYA